MMAFNDNQCVVEGCGLTSSKISQCLDYTLKSVRGLNFVRGIQIDNSDDRRQMGRAYLATISKDVSMAAVTQ